jgi:hypothetical protein
LPRRSWRRADRRRPLPDAPDSTASWIARLAAADARQREEAARELFRRGCAAAEPVLKRWFADAEFRKLLPSGNVLLTVGVAVEPGQFATIRQHAGNARLAEAPPDQDALEFELAFAHGVRLDVLTTRDPAGQGAIARFLGKFGEAIQQVECDVRDVTRATELLRARFAVDPVYPEARAGADGTRVNFFLVPAGEGRKILIELVEVPAKQQNRTEGRKL